MWFAVQYSALVAIFRNMSSHLPATLSYRYTPSFQLNPSLTPIFPSRSLRSSSTFPSSRCWMLRTRTTHVPCVPSCIPTLSAVRPTLRDLWGTHCPCPRPLLVATRER